MNRISCVSIRKLAPPVLLALVIIAGAARVFLRQEDYASFTPNGEITNEATFGGFAVKTYRTAEGEGSFEILRGKHRIYGQHGVCFYLAGDSRGDTASMRAPIPGTDITGNGLPNVVIYEWTGGAHCSFIALVFELGDRCRLIATIDGRHSIPAFVDLDGDSKPEVILADCTFEYWPGCFADSPLPRVVLRWVNGRYTPDAKLMETPEPSAQELSDMAERIKSQDCWNAHVSTSDTYAPGCIPKELFQTALDLMYGGHEETGRRFIQMAWTPKYPVDKALLAVFDVGLSRSPYWNAIRKQRESNRRPNRDSPEGAPPAAPQTRNWAGGSGGPGKQGQSPI